MSAPSAARMLRQASRIASRTLTRQYQTSRQIPAIASRIAVPAVTSRCFSISIPRSAGLMPDAEEPVAPTPEPDAHEIAGPTDVSDEEFHEHADRYMESLNEKAEALQDSRQDVEVEFSAGVMSITFPPSGIYVINKQPPNKQIWLASPISGPKRFDWVIAGESMHEKQGGGAGDWIYLRDGTSLTDLLRREMGISVDIDGDAEALVKPSVEPIE